MAPYSKKVQARYDGKNLILDEPLDLAVDEVVDITVDSKEKLLKPTDPRPLAERLATLDGLGKRVRYGKLTDDVFNRDETMYPDRW